MAADAAELMSESGSLELGNVEIKDAGAASKEVSVEIPQSVVDSRLEDSFSMLVANATLPGFRPGRVPRKLLERRFGSSISDETRQKLVSEAYEQVVKEHDLKVLGNPVVKQENLPELERGKGFAFSFEVEVLPEFELPDLTGLKIDKPMLEVTDELIEQEVTAQAERRGSLETLDGAAGEGDFIIGKIEVHDLEGGLVAELPEGASRMPTKEQEGKGQVGGIQVDDFDKKFKGKKADDVVKLELKGPENHELEAIREKDIVITFTITRIAKLVPAKIEELVQQTGVESEEVFRERVSEAIGQQINTEQVDVMRRQVVRYLNENIEIDLPERASAAQIQRTIQNTRMELAQRGLTEIEVEENMAEIRSASASRALADMKSTFILERLAEHTGVEVTEPEVNQQIAMIAFQQGMRPEALRNQLIESGNIMQLANRVRLNKAIDAVILDGDINEVSVEDWNKMMEKEDSAQGGSAGAPDAKKKTTKKKTTKKKSSSKKKDD